MTESNRPMLFVEGTAQRVAAELPPAWREFIRFCADLRHGEIERLSIQKDEAVKNAEYEELTAAAMSKPGKAGCGDWNEAEGALFREADITPVSTQALNYWGKGAEFEVNMAVLFPTSLRVTG